MTIGRLFDERVTSPTASGKVLLIEKALIAGNKNLYAAFFRSPQQLTVFQITPSHVRSGDEIVPAEQVKAGS